MKDILSQAQKYIQLEEVRWGSTIQPPKKENERENAKRPPTLPKKVSNRERNGYTKRSQQSSPQLSLIHI